jgi:hypothetical protein
MFLRIPLLTSPSTINAASGYAVSGLYKVLCCTKVLAVAVYTPFGEGVYTALTMTKENDLGRKYG